MASEEQSEKQIANPEQNFTDLRAALDDSSDKNRNLLIAFLVLQVYVFSATFSITDLQLLLLDSAQSFSLFNFAIPMEGFFYVVPPVIFAFHFNLLLNLRQHAIKLDDWLHHRNFLHQKHMNLLRPFIFNMRAKDFLTQNNPISAARIICFLLFNLLPLCLLTFVMWRLADLQDGILIAFHCLWIIADIVALIYFWPKISKPNQPTTDKLLLLFTASILLLVIIKTKYTATTIHFPHKLNNLDNNLFLSLVVPRLVITDITLNKQDKDRVNVGHQTPQDNEQNNNKEDKTKEDTLTQQSAQQSAQQSLQQSTVNQCHQGIMYQPIDLRKRNFNLIDLTGSVICNVNFTSAKLKGANFKDATFSGKFNLADLRYAKLYYTKLQRQSSFIAAKLSHTEIHQTIANQVNFTFATINNATITGTQFSQSQFLQAKIEATTILESQFDHAELVGASVKDTTFNQSKFKLTNLDLRLVTGLNKQYFENGTIQNCKIDYQSIPNSYTEIDSFRYLYDSGQHTEISAAIWNNSQCSVLYAPPENAQLVAIHTNPNNQDNRQALVTKLINANKLTNNDSLNLSNMGLTEINEAIFALSHLKQLNLSNNLIFAIPDAIANLSQLQQLDLSSNQIPTIPEAIANLSQLQQLDLSFNEINTFPDAIANLSQLQQLDLSRNQMNTIPDAIANLSQLQRLGLLGNQISTIPEAIANLSQLQQLDLSENKINTIPEAIANLSQLQRLDLSSNWEIETLPTTLLQLKNLTALCLGGTKIKTLPTEPTTLEDNTQFCELAF